LQVEICCIGSPMCEAARKNLIQAFRASGAGPEIQYTEIRDPRQIVSMGVKKTPAIFINGTKVSEGRVPKPSELKALFEENLNTCK